MEYPERIWHYTPVQTEIDFTDRFYRHNYSIYAVTRNKPEHWEILRVVYQYMRKLYGKNHPHYERRLQTILYHAEPPYKLVATFASEQLLIWSSDPATQEKAKQTFPNWQQIKSYYDDLIGYCVKRKKDIEEVLKILNGKYDGKTIYYKPPNIRWKLYRSGLKIKENYINYDGRSYLFTDFFKLSEAENQFCVDLFNALYEYLYNEACEGKYNPEIQFIFDYLDKDNKLILQKGQYRIESYDDGVFWENVAVLWSNNSTDQEHTKQTFPNWKSIEEYYNQYVTRWINYKDIDVVNSFVENRILKTERKIKREQNDPTNPAARKRKARRHLQRLGYDLHKSRKITKTEDDRGLYQIVKLGTGEIVAGKIFDLTLDQVEQFYMDSDYAKRECYTRDTMGYMYNKEPNLENRKEAAQNALRKKGYSLEVYDEREFYNSSSYRIRLMKNKYKVKYYTDWDKNKYLLNGESETFTLSEVEAFLSKS